MKSKLLSFACATFAVLVLFTLSGPAAFAQDDLVVDEVVAQVNNDIITLSQVRREMKEAADAMIRQQHMTPEQASAEVARRRPEIIATLINEQLLLQKGKELDLSEEVEAEVNRRMLDVAREQGITSIEQLYEAMRAAGLNPEEIRQTMRIELMKQAVLQRDVDAKLFYGLNLDELHAYYEAHKDRFRKPESVALSEIFLSLAGKNEADVRAKALQIIAQARAGSDFGALAVANSEREDKGKRVAPETKGKVGRFEVPNLRADIATAITSVAVGGVSEPIRSDEGYQILHVDERTPASNVSVFNENAVREAITIERSEKARKDYLQNLLADAYVKIGENYRNQVAPLLNLKETPAPTTNTPAAPTKKKG